MRRRQISDPIFNFRCLKIIFVTSTRSVEVTSIWKCYGKKEEKEKRKKEEEKMSVTHFVTSRGERFVLYLNHFSTDCSQILQTTSLDTAE